MRSRLTSDGCQLQRTLYIENMFRDAWCHLHGQVSFFFFIWKSLSTCVLAHVSVRKSYFLHMRLWSFIFLSSPQQQDQHTGSPVCLLQHCSLYINLNPSFTLRGGLLESMLMSRIWCIKEVEKEQCRSKENNNSEAMIPFISHISLATLNPKLLIISLWVALGTAEEPLLIVM